MSKAFTREDDADQQSDLPERAIPPYPNLVTAVGLAQIEDALTRLTEQHNDARAAGDAAATASTARDMRYWSARRAKNDEDLSRVFRFHPTTVVMAAGWMKMVAPLSRWMRAHFIGRPTNSPVWRCILFYCGRRKASKHVLGVYCGLVSGQKVFFRGEEDATKSACTARFWAVVIKAALLAGGSLEASE